MLADNQPIAFVATIRPDRAKAFYKDVLGLRLLEDSPFAIRFSIGGITLHVQKVQQLSPHPFTALGWRVADIKSTVQQLSGRGIKFERYPQLPQDELGVWTTPDGGQVCWFKDPDGNTLSLTQVRA